MRRCLLLLALLFSARLLGQVERALPQPLFQLGVALDSARSMQLSLRHKRGAFSEEELALVRAELARLGGAMGTHLGGLLTISIPTSQIQSLRKALPFAEAELHPPDEPLSMSVSRGNSQIGGAWRGVNVDTAHALGFTGKGVLVGVVDDGFDIYHGDFKDANGKTRILFVWNQMNDAPAQFPTSPAYAYGTEWDSAAINANLASVPNNAHGTNCLGILAGDGSQSGEKGVAPDANIILVVRKTGTGATSANVVDAFNYIQKKAKQLGLPVSISYSIGGHSGAHDGTRDQELAIDSLSGNGVLFATAAGNDRTTGVYTNAFVSQNSTTDLLFTAINPSGFFVGNAWISGSDSVGVSLVAPNGVAISTIPTDSTTPILSVAEGQFQLSNKLYAPNGDWNIQWGIRPTASHVGTWRLRLHGGNIVSSGKVDAWRTSASANGVWQNPIHEKTIVTPSTADSTIAVAAFQISDGAISPVSSVGRTRDERDKPELAAPTNVTTTAGSLGGTSASAPHVAGVAALLLQAEPTLSVSRCRQLLLDSARTDAQTGSIPPFSVSWGNGKVHAFGALRRQNPFAPLALSASAIAPTSLMLSWSGASSQFRLEQNGSVIYEGTATSQLVAGLSPNSTHTFSLRGKQATTNALSPSQISLVVATPAIDTNIAAIAKTRTFHVGEGTSPFSLGTTGATLHFPSGVTTSASFTAIRWTTQPSVVGALPSGIANISADGYWTIGASSGPSVGAYSLSLDLTGFGGISNFNSLKVLKRLDPSSVWQKVEDLGASVSYNAPVIAISNLTTFSDFVVASVGDNPLPVSLTAFSARQSGASALLEWRTMSERNNLGFVVLREERGEWRAIASHQTSQALRGGGTTTIERRYEFLDRLVEIGNTYRYKLRSVDFDGTLHDYAPVAVVEMKSLASEKPRQYALHQNYPNPFNPTTVIRYDLPVASDVKLELFDALGRKVATLVEARQGAGVYFVSLNASNLSSGLYVCSLKAGAFSATRKLLLMK
ncbi:MAG: S8/S53 family peptidase [Chloroherpetonaceae bacterium]|nr:S8/S53 family peptidase [Chloroherpetonaceae bacterium]